MKALKSTADHVIPGNKQSSHGNPKASVFCLSNPLQAQTHPLPAQMGFSQEAPTSRSARLWSVSQKGSMDFSPDLGELGWTRRQQTWKFRRYSLLQPTFTILECIQCFYLSLRQVLFGVVVSKDAKGIKYSLELNWPSIEGDPQSWYTGENRGWTRMGVWPCSSDPGTSDFPKTISSGQQESPQENALFQQPFSLTEAHPQYPHYKTSFSEQAILSKYFGVPVGQLIPHNPSFPASFTCCCSNQEVKLVPSQQGSRRNVLEVLSPRLKIQRIPLSFLGTPISISQAACECDQSPR